MSERKDDYLRRNVGAGIAGAGGVGMAAGYAMGGVPGVRVTHGSVLQRGLQGGIFGSRLISHDDYAKELARKELRSRAAKRSSEFKRARMAGKRTAESEIINALKVGRKVGNVTFIGGTGATLAGLSIRNKRNVSKAEDRKRSTAPGALIGTGATLVGVGTVVPAALDREANKWSKREANSLARAGRLVPSLAGRAKPVPDSEKVTEHTLGARSKRHGLRTHGPSFEDVRLAGQLHGEASQARYFSHVYRAHSKGVKYARPVGGGLIALGAGGAVLSHERNKVRKDDQTGHYPYLLPSIRTEMQIGIPETRMNPISPMQMMAASNIAAKGVKDLKSRNPFGRGERIRRGVVQLALGSSMLSSPLGYGVSE